VGHDALAITTIGTESHVSHLIRESLIKLRRLRESWQTKSGKAIEDIVINHADRLVSM
jgi:hypothetical protein